MHTIQRLFLTICISFIGVVAMAEGGIDVKRQADEAYSRSQYAEAIQLYESIIAGGESSHEVYYNLGCAYYREGELGHAIVSYERALRLRPSDRDTRQNLAFCYAQTQDHIEALPEFFLLRWWHAMVGAITLVGWQVLLLVAVALMMAAVAWFMLSRSIVHRRNALLCSVVAVVLVAVMSAALVSAHSALYGHEEAIVMQPVVSVKAEPSASATARFELHEGTKVEVMEEQPGWFRIAIADGNNGWAPLSEIERI